MADILADALEGGGKGVFALLPYDARRGVILRHRPLSPSASSAMGEESARASVALDHLPPAVRKAVQEGKDFVSVGDQSVQYATLLGLEVPAGEVRLLFKGIVIDQALTAILAACFGGGRMSAKVSERLDLLGALFELAYARRYEQDARREAVTTLHEVTERLRVTHAETVAELEREILRLRTARGDVIDRKRVEQLQAAAENAKRRAAQAEQQLAAVEQQVSSAVERLERAHVQLHQHSELARAQAETIRRLEARLGVPHPAETSG
jgi:hypothetical protein